jgi:hypothetical protein
MSAAFGLLHICCSHQRVTVFGASEMYTSALCRLFNKEFYDDIPNVTVWRTMGSFYAFKCKRSRNTGHAVTFGIPL